MCKVSDKLQLCTCQVPSKDCHHWILFRWVKGKNEYLIGQCMPPFNLDPTTNELNARLLLSLLNDRAVFDADIILKERDRLLLSFYFPEEYSIFLKYGFSYRRKKWQPKEYDPLEWLWHHDEIKEGRILNAFADL